MYNQQGTHINSITFYIYIYIYITHLLHSDKVYIYIYAACISLLTSVSAYMLSCHFELDIYFYTIALCSHICLTHTMVINLQVLLVHSHTHIPM